MHVFGHWEETGVRVGTPHKNEENVQSPPERPQPASRFELANHSTAMLPDFTH